MAGSSLRAGLRAIAAQLDSVTPGPEALGPAAPQARRAQQLVAAADVLTRAGVIRAERPDHAVRALSVLFRWGMTPAAGFTVSAVRYPDEPAIVDEIGMLTFGQVDRRTNALAHAFADAGITEDDAVAIMCRDHRGFIEATVALSKLGATAIFLNTAFAAPQLVDVVRREKPAGIVYDEEFAEALTEVGRRRKRWLAWTDEEDPSETTLEELIREGDPEEVVPPETVGRMTLLTSGSTGTPKGASRGQPAALESIVALLSRMPLRAREPTVLAAPLFHAWGFLHFNLGLILSSTYVLRRHFDPEATLGAIDRHRATTLVAVPVMLQRILELPGATLDRYETSSLRVVAASGGALPAELAQRFMDRFGDILYNLYGSTEVAWAAIATPEDLRAAPGTVGRAPRGTSLKIFGEDEQELDPGERGRIFVRNEMLFEGYTGGQREEMLDGHMATGDLGRLDGEGRLFVEGRADDMIVSGGENVYPEEVETTLEDHPKISEAAVIGVEDPEFGQRLKAFVVGDVSEDQVKSHVKSNLARFKVPREVEFRDSLPRNPQGKVQKQELQEDDKR